MGSVAGMKSLLNICTEAHRLMTSTDGFTRAAEALDDRCTRSNVSLIEVYSDNRHRFIFTVSLCVCLQIRSVL